MLLLFLFCVFDCFEEPIAVPIELALAEVGGDGVESKLLMALPAMGIGAVDEEARVAVPVLAQERVGEGCITSSAFHFLFAARR